MIVDYYYENYKSYLCNIIPLKLFYAWTIYQQEGGRLPMAFILEHYVDFWRKTVYFDGVCAPSNTEFYHPEWIVLRAQLCGLHQECQKTEDSHTFEKEGFNLVWPHIEPAIKRDSPPPRKGAARPYGAWNVTFRSPTVVSIHITNVYRPDSIFDHPDEFAEDLLRLLIDIQDANPSIETLFCGSWLNNLPPFQRFFPPEWVFNLNNPVRRNDTNGLWGQYMSRTGGYHKKNGNWLRRTGYHRYPLIHSHCGILSATAYLKSNGWKYH